MSDILDQAKEHYKTAKDGWQEIYRKARDDLHFLSDEPYAQWDAQTAANRTSVGRPTVEIDQLSQFIHQVSNDIRQNTPTIKVIPSGDGADIETAEFIEGRIKAIEYKSNADAAYDMAADFSVKSSIGFIRVDHRYLNNKGFEQELFIQRVINPSSCMIDPMSIQADGSDANYGFVFEEMYVSDFKRKWPKAAPISFGEEKPSKALIDTDKITIAEYFVLENKETEMGLKEDGTSEPKVEGIKYKSTRKINKPRVLRYKLAGQDELESTTFPGQYVPIVPVYGEESWIEGKRNLYSLIRKSKSAQMMYNELKSSETEILMKQQQAPVMAAVGQMRNFEDDWKKPDKAMVLYYHQTDATGQACPPPQRLVPPEVSAGFANASQDAENNIRKTMGMYNAGVGKREGNASGVALKQLEMSGDTASLHFGDNLTRSISHVGKILVCALPEIEDTPRIVSTIGKEDEMKSVGINGMVVEGQDKSFKYDDGEWDVRVITGASFTTQRQEAADFYGNIITKMPDLMPVIGDLVFKYQDAPGAQAISSRLKKLVDPKLLDESERDQGQDPALLQMQAQLQQVTQEAQAQIGQLTAQLENKQGDLQVKMAEVQVKMQEVEVKKDEIQLKLIEAQKPDGTALDAQQQAFDQEMKQREMALKEAEFQLKVEQANQQAEQQPQQQLSQPMGIKLDTTGFQMMKTPEREQADAQAEQMELQLKEADLTQRQQQAEILTQSLASIAQQVSQLVQAVQQPIKINRDENGNMVTIQ